MRFCIYLQLPTVKAVLSYLQQQSFETEKVSYSMTADDNMGQIELRNELGRRGLDVRGTIVELRPTKSKRGSYTYKEGILNNLARRGITTTEGLSILDSDQVGEMREKNKGKFADKSRYMINNDNSPSEPLSLEKSDAYSDDDRIFKPEDKAQGSLNSSISNPDDRLGAHCPP